MIEDTKLTIKHKTGLLHIYTGGSVEFTGNGQGQLHRRCGPATIHYLGRISYWQADVRHRTDGPAIIWPNGTKEYWVNGNELLVEEFFTKYGAV